jgi:hypothetical protein
MELKSELVEVSDALEAVEVFRPTMDGRTGHRSIDRAEGH